MDRVEDKMKEVSRMRGMIGGEGGRIGKGG